MARYVIVILASLFFLVFAYSRSSAAQAASTPSNPDGSASLHVYVTTVNNLNVREAPNSKSTILKVVKKGTLLSVQATVAGGWLKLADGGGYVKGAYAKLVPSKPSAKVKTLSYAEPDKSASDSARISQAASSKQAAQATLPLSAVESFSGLTEAKIKLLFEDTELLGHGLEKAVLDIEAEYGINAYFTIAVMKLESGNGTSKLSDNKNNLFGISNGKGGYLSFKAKADSVHRFGRLISENYIDEGYATIEQISGKYCPPNKEWAALVKNIVKRDHKLLAGESV